MYLEMSSVKWRSFYPGGEELNYVCCFGGDIRKINYSYFMYTQLCLQAPLFDHIISANIAQLGNVHTC